MDAKALFPDQTDDPLLFEVLTQRPKMAWSTAMLLVAAFAIFSLSTSAYVRRSIITSRKNRLLLAPSS